MRMNSSHPGKISLQFRQGIQVRSHLGGMIFLHVNSFCRTVPPKQDCSFSLDSACFCDYYVKKCNSFYEISQCGCLSVIRYWNKNKHMSKQWNWHNFLKIVMQANWDEKHLTQVGYFSDVNVGWKVSHSGEMSHLI